VKHLGSRPEDWSSAIFQILVLSAKKKERIWAYQLDGSYTSNNLVH
jgi:hypothetical protein